MQRLVTATALLACILLTAAIPGAANEPGETLYVTKLVEGVDDIDTNPGDGVCATAESECTLRAAVQEGNALPGTQTISLPLGDHALVRGGCCEDDADTGDVDITDDIRLVGSGAGQTAITEISGLGGVERIFDVRSGTAVTIRDLTVRDVFMSAYLPPDTEYCGGGIRNAGNLMLMRVDIVDNVFRRSGGGICNQGQLHVADSTISGNQAGLVGRGGGILNEVQPSWCA